jgi:hypothetical protein
MKIQLKIRSAIDGQLYTGMQHSREALLFSGDELRRKIETGAKGGTTRKWCQKRVDRWKKKVGQLVRLQTNWAADTIFGWGLILGVRSIVIGVDLDELMLDRCGCVHMTQRIYIKTFWDGDVKGKGVFIEFQYKPLLK